MNYTLKRIEAFINIHYILYYIGQVLESGKIRQNIFVFRAISHFAYPRIYTKRGKGKTFLFGFSKNFVTSSFESVHKPMCFAHLLALES